MNQNLSNILNKTKNNAIGFLKERTIMFYVALGTAGLAIVTAIIYVVALNHLTAYISWIPFVLMLVGAFAFAVLALYRLPRLGAAVMSALCFGAFLIFAGTIYEYPVDSIMVGMVDELNVIIVSAVLMFVCVVVSNVCAWMSLQKKTVVSDRLIKTEAE